MSKKKQSRYASKQSDVLNLSTVRKLSKLRKSLGFTPEQVTKRVAVKSKGKCPCELFTSTAKPSPGPGIWLQKDCFLTSCKLNKKDKVWNCKYDCYASKVAVFDL